MGNKSLTDKEVQDSREMQMIEYHLELAGKTLEKLSKRSKRELAIAIHPQYVGISGAAVIDVGVLKEIEKSDPGSDAENWIISIEKGGCNLALIEGLSGKWFA